MRLDRLTLLGQRPCDVGAVNADGEGVVNVVGDSPEPIGVLYYVE